MKIELKNIHHYPRMSEETECYEASLYVDGRKIGQVSNRGTGGCDDFYGDRAAFERAEEWVKLNMPNTPSLEEVCGELLGVYLDKKELQKHMAKKVLLVENGHLYEVSFGGKPDASQIARVKAEHPNSVVLNGLPIEKAVQIYRGQAA